MFTALIYQLIEAKWSHMASGILVNIGPGHGLPPAQCQAIT